MRGATLAKYGQSANGQKEDRIQMTAAGFATPPGHPRHGHRAARQPRVHHHQAVSSHRRRPCHRASRRCRPSFPPSIPSSSIPTQTPVGASGEADDAPQAVSVNVVDVPGGILPQSDGVELQPGRGRLVGRRGRRDFRLCRRRDRHDRVDRRGRRALLQAAYHPEDATGLGSRRTPP